MLLYLYLFLYLYLKSSERSREEDLGQEESSHLRELIPKKSASISLIVLLLLLEQCQLQI